MATLDQILHFRNLTDMVLAVKSGIPNPLGPEWYAVDRRVSGNMTEFFRVNGNRQLARLVEYGAPAVNLELQGVELVGNKMVHLYQSQQWPMTIMTNLTKMNELAKDAKGRQQAEFQSMLFKGRISRTRIAVALMTLFTGKIFVDKNGNILPTTTGSAYTIDALVPAANQNQLGGTIGASWATTSTDIVTQLTKLKTKAVQTTGYEIENAFYGDSIAGAIATNTTAQAYLARNPQLNGEYIKGGTIPSGFGGIKNWIPAGSSFFADKDNVVQNILGTNSVVFTPAASTDWWGCQEGSFMIPSTLNIGMGQTAAEMQDMMVEMFGPFAYALLTHNPSGVQQFAGDTFGFTLKVPAAVWQGTVIF